MKTHHIKSLARQAVERAILWRVTFTADDIQTFAGLSERGVKIFLSTLVAKNVLIRTGRGFTAGQNGETWRLSPPKARPGGTDEAYLRRKAILDRWRQEAWETERGEKNSGPKRNEAQEKGNIQFNLMEVASMWGVTDRCIRKWIARGLLAVVDPTRKHDRKVSYNEITRFMEGRKS